VYRYHRNNERRQRRRFAAPGDSGHLRWRHHQYSIRFGSHQASSTIGDSTYGESSLFINNKTIVINGNGAIIERLNSVNRLRLFYVNPLAKLTLQNVTLRNGKALGGNGASAGGGGGGGAAGLGGAILE